MDRYLSQQMLVMICGKQIWIFCETKREGVGAGGLRPFGVFLEMHSKSRFRPWCYKCMYTWLDWVGSPGGVNVANEIWNKCECGK